MANYFALDFSMLIASDGKHMWLCSELYFLVFEGPTHIGQRGKEKAKISDSSKCIHWFNSIYLVRSMTQVL